ncbi:MAG: hypothetical protein V2I54_06220 [Bacteroidales bacterium]|jgi:hypothetical protein|nr:hypothetical protein [Bacteroidales bacterium]
MIKNLFLQKPKIRHLVLITLSIVALFLHGKVPYMLPFSLGMLSLLIIDFLFIHRNGFRKISGDFATYIKRSWLYLFTLLIFFFSVIIHKEKELLLFKELLYAVYIWVIMGLLCILIKQDKISEKKFYELFQLSYIVLFLIVIAGIFLNFINENIQLNYLFGNRIDYNYLTLALITCFIIIVYRYNKPLSLRKSWVWLIYLFVLLVPGLLSGSRRGIFLWGLLHVFLFIYLIWTIYCKSLHKVLLYYFIILFAIVFSSSVLFYAGSPAFKSYMVERLFPTNAQQVKFQYSQILYRYSSLTNNNSVSFREFYRDNWNPEPFQSRSWLNKIMFRKIHKRFLEVYKQEKYDEAFRKLIDLRNFSTSIEQYRNVLPDDYSKFFTEEFVSSDSFYNAPYIYPIPYIDKDLFLINKLKNIYPVSEIEKPSQRPLPFVKTSNEENYISLFVPLVPNTHNEISIEYKGIKPDKLKFNIQGHKRTIPYQKTISKQTKSQYNSVVIKFNTVNEDQGLGRLLIMPEISFDDTLYLGNQSHLRLPTEYSPDYYNTNEFAGTVKRMYSEIEQKHNNYYERYINWYKELSDEEKEKFNYLLNNFHLYDFKFKPYGVHASLNQIKKQSIVFRATGFSSFARCYTVIPTLKDIRYSINLIVKSDKKPDIYLKRFPERTIFDHKTKTYHKEIKLLYANTYRINIEYEIIRSSSALGALIVGIHNAKEGDVFEITEAEVNIKKKKSQIEITPYHYSFLEPYIGQVILSGNYGDTNNMKKYLGWGEQNFKKSHRMIDSRLVLWRFAWFYFKDFSFLEKLFGKGFEYLTIYHHIFDTEGQNSDGVDYPHNPVISALLYSGILGAVVYVLFLLQVFYRYWKLRKRITLFAILFLLAFAFTFFSGNSHFSVPAFIILSLVPYAYNIKPPIHAAEEIKA